MAWIKALAPPVSGRWIEPFFGNGWTTDDEYRLFDLLCKTKAKFILSTWHHNDYRPNKMIGELWKKFDIVTRDHFYHSGAKIENRRAIVEALVHNFHADIKKHNHDLKEKRQMARIF